MSYRKSTMEHLASKTVHADCAFALEQHNCVYTDAIERDERDPDVLV